MNNNNLIDSWGRKKFLQTLLFAFGSPYLLTKNAKSVNPSFALELFDGNQARKKEITPQTEEYIFE